MPKKAITKYEKGKLYDIPIKDLEPDPNQPRKHMDETELAGLKESISEQGLLQPILFRQDEKDGLIVVAGERRYQACKELKKETIPCILTDGDPMEIALIENLVREDLTPMAKAEALQKLKDGKNYEQKTLAAMFGKSESVISEILSLNKLPDEIKEECLKDHNFALRRLKTIANEKNSAKKMKALFDEYKKQLAKSEPDGKRTSSKGNAIQAEIKRVGSTRERLIEFKNKWEDEKKSKSWKDAEKKKIKAELLELKKIIDEILGNEK